MKTNTATPTSHVPVMLERCLDALAPQPDTWLVDGTFGAGGHTRALLARGARVLAVDQDPHALAHAEALRNDLRTAGVSEPSERFRFVHGNFVDLATHLQAVGLPARGGLYGVLLDLGVSSMQLDEGERGFAFRKDGPLDMRMSGEGRSAADLIVESDEAELAALLYRYGEERHSRRLARAIVAAREEAPILTTGRLAEVIRAAYPGGPRRDHPARRTFQALRIVVNDELGELERGLAASEGVLKPGGRCVVVSFHSLEDRIVKNFFRSRSTAQPRASRHLPDAGPAEAPAWRLLTRRPVVAGPDEVAANPRARSAKLRAAERMPATAGEVGS